MDVKEVRKRKSDLEEEISKMIQDFEETNPYFE